MSEAKPRYRLVRHIESNHLSYIVDNSDGRGTGRPLLDEDATRIVAALNENETLREQVRLYELAAERGWTLGKWYLEGRKGPITWWCGSRMGLQGDGPTPTAAIAAAEKKEQAK